jgi:hypothetical protein
VFSTFRDFNSSAELQECFRHGSVSSIGGVGASLWATAVEGN